MINNKKCKSKSGERNTNDVGREGESGEAKVKVTAATTSTSHPHTTKDLGRDSFCGGLSYSFLPTVYFTQQ